MPLENVQTGLKADRAMNGMEPHVQGGNNTVCLEGDCVWVLWYTVNTARGERLSDVLRLNIKSEVVWIQNSMAAIYACIHTCMYVRNALFNH